MLFHHITKLRLPHKLLKNVPLSLIDSKGRFTVVPPKFNMRKTCYLNDS